MRFLLLTLSLRRWLKELGDASEDHHGTSAEQEARRKGQTGTSGQERRGDQDSSDENLKQATLLASGKLGNDVNLDLFVVELSVETVAGVMTHNSDTLTTCLDVWSEARKLMGD